MKPFSNGFRDCIEALDFIGPTCKRMTKKMNGDWLDTDVDTPIGELMFEPFEHLNACVTAMTDDVDNAILDEFVGMLLEQAEDTATEDCN